MKPTKEIPRLERLNEERATRCVKRCTTVARDVPGDSERIEISIPRPGACGEKKKRKSETRRWKGKRDMWKLQLLNGFSAE